MQVREHLDAESATSRDTITRLTTDLESLKSRLASQNRAKSTGQADQTTDALAAAQQSSAGDDTAASTAEATATSQCTATAAATADVYEARILELERRLCECRKDLEEKRKCEMERTLEAAALVAAREAFDKSAADMAVQVPCVLLVEVPPGLWNVFESFSWHKHTHTHTTHTPGTNASPIAHLIIALQNLEVILKEAQQHHTWPQQHHTCLQEHRHEHG